MPKSLFFLAALASLLPATTGAQSLASPFGKVSQTVDSTTITIEYYRPSMRGRRIFGGLVRWGELWTPGANWATTLEVNRPVRIDGHALPAGKYSVWFIPARELEPWTIVLNRAARRFHVMRPNPTDDQLRFKVSPDSGAEQEMLTFTFPVVSRDAATLAFGWARTQVNLHFEITSSRRTIVASHRWSSYTGAYSMRFANDSAAPAVSYEISERSNALWVRTVAAAVEAGLDAEFDLLPAGGDTFHPRQYKNGRHIGDELDELIVFHMEGDRATGFEIRGLAEQRVLARATLVRR